jgi:hypothetical protein
VEADDVKAAAKAERDAELHAASEAECLTVAKATKREAAEQAAHWAPRDGQG